MATVIPHSFAVGIWSFTGIFLSAREMVIWYFLIKNDIWSGNVFFPLNRIDRKIAEDKV